MLAKAALLFLLAMAVLALWGRWSASRRLGRFCARCGRPRPCGCPKGGA
jgi:hypothetical protein